MVNRTLGRSGRLRTPSRVGTVAAVTILALIALVIGSISAASAATGSRIRLMVSAAPDRSKAHDLNGAKLTGNAYIFVRSNASAITSVSFYIDNTSGTNQPTSTHTTGPYDLVGTEATREAKPLDTATLAAGDRNVLARVVTPTGTIDLVGKFTVTHAGTAGTSGTKKTTTDNTTDGKSTSTSKTTKPSDSSTNGSATTDATTAATAKLPSGALKIMPMGASITEGGGSVEGAYRIKLYQLLKDAGYDFDFVGSAQNGPASLPDKDHEGHGGWCLAGGCYSNEVMAGKAGGWVKDADPDLILLHAGTNDLNSGDSAAEITEHLQTVLDEIYEAKPTVRIIVAKLVHDNGASDEIQDEFADDIDTVVKTYAAKGRAISAVDMTNALSADDYTDETHPNLDGYNKMADVWMAGITKIYGK